jgi:ketosteroid isomerase-like protein
MRVQSAVAAGAMVLGLACAAEPDDQDEVSIEEQSAAFRSAVEAILAKYEQWEAAGQIDSILTLYTENVVLAFANQPIIEGKQAVRDNAAQMYAMGTPSLDLRTQSATASGDLGVERGTYVFNMTLAQGAPAAMAALFPDSGSYLTHWHRVNGEWKAAEVVVNSMKPLPGMEAMMTAPQGR